MIIMHARIEDGKVTQIAEIRSMFPHISFPEIGPDLDMCAALGVRPVVAQLPVTDTQKLIHIAPEISEDAVYTVRVVEKTEDDIAHEQAARASTAASATRAQRDHMLSACDWTQVNDAPLTDSEKLAWAQYRQALRDVPSQAGFPWEVQWPAAVGSK